MNSGLTAAVATLKIQEMWLAYLESVGLNEKTMLEVQIQETKRAFMAGMGMMFASVTNLGSNNEPDEDVFNSLDSLQSQLQVFWQIEIGEF